MNSSSAATYAVINANEILEGGSFNPESLNVESFRADLQVLAREIIDPDPSIKLYLRFSGQFPQAR